MLSVVVAVVRDSCLLISVGTSGSELSLLLFVKNKINAKFHSLLIKTQEFITSSQCILLNGR